jgi:Lrp/AsnC family transcriptional regulator, regulator for asnA, asnC and gidA
VTALVVPQRERVDTTLIEVSARLDNRIQCCIDAKATDSLAPGGPVCDHGQVDPTPPAATAGLPEDLGSVLEDGPLTRPEPGERSVVGLDSISKAIIEQLQSDGRRAYARIASAVGLSEAAVRQRVARLIEADVMQIVAVTNPLQLGFARQAMIGIKAEGNLDPLVEALGAMPEVDYLVITAGSFDIMAEVVCADDDHLLDLMNHKIRTIPGVRATESFVYLKLAKQTYQWGTR